MITAFIFPVIVFAGIVPIPPPCGVPAFAQVFITSATLLWWVPLVLAGLAGPIWLGVLYWRKSAADRRLSHALEEDFIP